VNAPLKILHVSPWFAPAWRYGGLVEAVYQLARHAAAQGAAVRVLTTDADGGGSLSREAVEAIAHESGFEVTCCHRAGGESVSLSLPGAMASHVKWADIVHLHAAYSFPTIPAMLAARLIGRPLVWMPHGALQRWSGSRRPQLKEIWEGVCRAIAPAGMTLHLTSSDEARESQVRFPHAALALIPNGVDIPETMERAPRGEALRVGYIGRLDQKKGIENLLDACRAIKERGTLHIALEIAGAGEPPYEESLRRRIGELEISGMVTMLGEIRGPAKSDFFARQDVMMLPSYTENFGIVAAEALAHGVPVIASRGTPWEELETRHCGLWVANDAASLAAAIDWIAVMPLAEMGANGRRWMTERYSWKRATDELFELYERMITRASRAALAIAD
jgi:glycosyltransferase involved in cell wall biosynthesis